MQAKTKTYQSKPKESPRDKLYKLYKTIIWGGILIILCSIAMIITINKTGLVHRKIADAYTIPELYKGNIYSRDGQLLVSNDVNHYTINIDFAVFNLSAKEVVSAQDSTLRYEEFLAALKQVLSPRHFRKAQKVITSNLKKEEPPRYVSIINRQNALTKQEIYQIQEKSTLAQMDQNKNGIIIQQDTRRALVHGQIGRKVLLEEDKYGLANTFKHYLNPKYGSRDFNQYPYSLTTKNMARPGRNGLDLISTLDWKLQKETHKLLNDRLIKENAEHGTAIIMDVKTGDILAMVNLSHNRSSNSYEENGLIYSVQGRHQPGSTFKTVTIGCLIDAGYIDSSTLVNTDKGYYSIPGKTYLDEKLYGIINPSEILKHSSNVATIKLVRKYYNDQKGIEAYYDAIMETGFFRDIDSTLTGSQAAEIYHHPGKKKWYPTDLASSAIGRFLETTPLQTLAYYNAIANQGAYVQPKLIHGLSFLGKIVHTETPKIVIDGVHKTETISFLQEALASVTQAGGTAPILKECTVAVAGKTGTNDPTFDSKGELRTQRRVSFCGFFPTQHPQYSCIVSIYGTRPGTYGGKTAAPVFKDIVNYLYPASDTSKTIAPNTLSHKTDTSKFIINELAHTSTSVEALSSTYPQLSGLEKEQATWAYIQANPDTLYSVKQADSFQHMPNIIGMKLQDALYLLETAGLKVSSRGTGRIYHQSIKAGTRLNKDQNIIIKLR